MADENDPQKPIVLILKSKNKDDSYERLLNERGYEAVFIPVLSFKFVNQNDIKERLENPEKHSGLVFTSQRAVEAVHRCVKDTAFEEKWSSSLKAKWSQLPVFVTGKATGEQVRERLNFSSIFGEDSGSAQALTQTILNTLPADSQKELLFPCANIKKETLPSALKEKGYGIYCVTAYCTQPDPSLAESLQKHFLNETLKLPECIVFFSPSGVNFAHDALQETLKSFQDIKLVAIGQSTAQELQKHGLTVSGVPDKPDPQSLLQVVDGILA
jgi:uroporphyrinogen-III synthase